MTDEKLEKKVRKIRWQEVVGAVAVTAGVFGGVVCCSSLLWQGA